MIYNINTFSTWIRYIYDMKNMILTLCKAPTAYVHSMSLKVWLIVTPDTVSCSVPHENASVLSLPSRSLLTPCPFLNVNMILAWTSSELLFSMCHTKTPAGMLVSCLYVKVVVFLSFVLYKIMNGYECYGTVIFMR